MEYIFINPNEGNPEAMEKLREIIKREFQKITFKLIDEKLKELEIE